MRFPAFGKTSALFTTVLIAGAPLACTSTRGESASDTAAANPVRTSSATSSSQSSVASTIADADSQRVVLDVKGMYCASCEQTVVTMLRRTAGVIRAEVSIQHGEATVSYDSTRTSPAQLVQVVKSLGYTASVKPT